MKLDDDCRGPSGPLKFGRRNVPKMIAQMDELRKAIRAEGTPRIQDIWDKMEEHIDYAYRFIPEPKQKP